MGGRGSLSITRQIIEEHLVEGKFEPGEEIALKIDQTLTQDATGTMAYLQFEALGITEVKTGLSVSYVDHNTIQSGFENADDHRYLKSIAAKYGIVFSKPGNGICHQVHLERFAIPGKTLLGSDSHTPTAGGIGMIAIGAGGLDVAMAMGGSPFYLSCPHVIALYLNGQLSPWVTAKDVALKVLELFTTRGNVGRVFEYMGEGVKTLSVPERATIANMGAECGVTTSVFPSDDNTLQFLRAQHRAHDWIELKADDDDPDSDDYEDSVEIDLNEIVPLAACPHSPDNIKPVAELEGMEVNQVCIGSCTNSSFKDLMTVAKMLEGKKVHPDVELVVAPGSRQVLENIAMAGGLTSLINAGARIAECTCGFCIGNSYSPATDAVSLRTSNRNFMGRSGTKSAKVYLVSPETAAAAAIAGRITDPRELGLKYPDIELPEQFYIDDSMILQPARTSATGVEVEVEVYRGPNIGSPPSFSPLPDTISGLVTIKVGDNITTDHIIPAGSRMKYRSNIAKYAEFVFEPLDRQFYKRASETMRKGKHNIIVAGDSYGQGSSREHAALCPAFLGVKAVIAKSFERIHMANLINFGILPLIFDTKSDYNLIDRGDELEIPNIRRRLSNNEQIAVRDKSKGGHEFKVCTQLTKRERSIILAGGLLPYIKEGIKGGGERG
ncbi:MAG: aconitate hydratase [Methanophagales archaeon]|nr:aconitate hydratase [Methanophagales archaeon]MCW3138233.1 aconitate hydratase [Methanophagales archaeon]MCW3140260.1 aconitate hydratase [Methanophagales archaeon]MCW7070659.1 aconitate hydratase [Methanophagales archaeon]MCW7072605.1 aconitate hydratase [Methanophagales archaeon]